MNTDKKIRLMGQPAINILKQLQPYKGGKQNELWVLHRLDIQDKHRLLIVAPTSIDSWHSTTKFIPSSEKLSDNRLFNSGAAVNSDNIFIPKVGDKLGGINPSFFFSGEEGELHVNFEFTGDIAFNEPGIIQHKSAFNALRDINNIVIDTVDKFEPLFSRSL